ncbi:MAG: class I SAM-dependent methyltransferase [Deltaproteobacteria bacterium]|jgi:SAM-dependent methyltransferase|nr:class I SAM-dependent methyltransferase [Deltaproteobacteria bacterium]
MTDISSKLVENWTESSPRYSSLVREELAGWKREAWLGLIAENAGGGPPLDVLDVGTGPGFFAIILAGAGHRVRAVDCTEAMVGEARRNIAEAGLEVEAAMADSAELPFGDGTFDLIVSRNVAWTLVDAEKAYREWHRVLRPGGRAMIFDANWNLDLFRDDYREAHERDLAEYRLRYPGKEVTVFTQQMIDFRKGMPQCSRLRPQWDVGALIGAGFATVYLDTDVGPRVYDESELLLYRTFPMFMLAAGRR